MFRKDLTTINSDYRHMKFTSTAASGEANRIHNQHNKKFIWISVRETSLYS